MESNFTIAQNNKDNLFDTLSNGKNLIIDYFFTCGVDYSNYNDRLTKEIKEVIPGILSIFPEHNSRYPFDNLNDIIIKHIFPQKDLIFLQNHDDNSKSLPIMKDYLIMTDSQPNKEFHIFSLNLQTTDDLFENRKHFACLIIYEDVSFLMKHTNSKKIYLGKALVITSIFPYYSLFRKILYIISEMINMKNTYALELFIINLIISLENPTNCDTIISIYDNPKIKIERKVFLPICDLNVIDFFTLFSIKDFLILADKFIKNETIYFFSEDLSLLHPTMFIFLSLIFPLNNCSRGYFPILVIDDSTIKSMLYDAGVGGMILLINSKLDLNQFKNRFKWVENTSVILVDLDTSNEMQRVQELHYSKKIEQINIKYSFPEIDDLNLSDLYYYLVKILDKYKKKSKSVNYFDDIYNNYDINEDTKFVRKFFFTYFCKIIHFYINYVSFDISKIFLFNDEQFLIYVQKNFPKNVQFYNSLLQNDAFCYIVRKDFHKHDPNLINLIFMEELINIPLKNKNLIYLDPYEYCESITSNNDAIKTINFDENSFKLFQMNNYFHLLKKKDIFNGKIKSEKNIVTIEYNLIPKFNFRYFFNYDFILSENLNTNYPIKTLIKDCLPFLLLNDLEILWKFIKKSDLKLDFFKSNIIIFILLLTFKLNSSFGIIEKQRDIIKLIFKIIRNSKLNVNFIYSFIYDNIISNNLQDLYESEFLNILVENNINPSYFIVFRKKDLNSEKLFKENNMSLLNEYSKINFELLHKCKYIKKVKDFKEYFINEISITNSIIYCKCQNDDISIKIKYPNLEKDNNLISPFFILLEILEFIYKKNQIHIIIEDWISQYISYFEILIFYFEVLKIDISILF